MLCNEKRGFTLVELLVVIAIIGLLASIVLVSLNTARTKARNVRRKADLHAMEVAITLYYDDHAATWPNNDLSDSTGGDWSDAFKAQLAPYLSVVPRDPAQITGTRRYGAYRLDWSTNPNCNGQYVLWAIFEGTNDPDYGKYDCGFTGYYFRLLGRY